MCRIYAKPTGNIILNSERQTAFPEDQDQDKDVCSHHFQSTSYWKFLTGGIGQEIKDIRIRKEVKLFLSTGNTIKYFEPHKKTPLKNY